VARLGATHRGERDAPVEGDEPAAVPDRERQEIDIGEPSWPENAGMVEDPRCYCVRCGDARSKLDSIFSDAIIAIA